MCDHVARAHRAAIHAAAFAHTNTAQCGCGEAALVVGKGEMRRRLGRIVRSTEAQMLVEAVGIDHLARIHLTIRIPGGLKFAECLHEFGAEHSRQQFPASLPVSVLPRDGAAIADHHICRFLHERPELADALAAGQVEVNPVVDAALPEVAVEGGGVIIAFNQPGVISQVAAQLIGWDSRVLPAFPVVMLTGDDGGRTQAGFAYHPDFGRLLRLIEELHGRWVRLAPHLLHQPPCLLQ
ncbi:MAG TPA: hypothetical protein VF043_22630, partial [Ktedonobacteraceae bacterium]